MDLVKGRQPRNERDIARIRGQPGLPFRHPLFQDSRRLQGAHPFAFGAIAQESVVRAFRQGSQVRQGLVRTSLRHQGAGQPQSKVLPVCRVTQDQPIEADRIRPVFVGLQQRRQFRDRVRIVVRLCQAEQTLAREGRLADTKLQRGHPQFPLTIAPQFQGPPVGPDGIAVHPLFFEPFRQQRMIHGLPSPFAGRHPHPGASGRLLVAAFERKFPQLANVFHVVRKQPDQAFVSPHDALPVVPRPAQFQQPPVRRLVARLAFEQLQERLFRLEPTPQRDQCFRPKRQPFRPPACPGKPRIDIFQQPLEIAAVAMDLDQSPLQILAQPVPRGRQLHRPLIRRDRPLMPAGPQLRRPHAAQRKALAIGIRLRQGDNPFMRIDRLVPELMVLIDRRQLQQRKQVFRILFDQPLPGGDGLFPRPPKQVNGAQQPAGLRPAIRISKSRNRRF